MIRSIFAVSLCSSLYLVSASQGHSRSAPEDGPQTAITPTSPVADPNVSRLLTKEEISAVQDCEMTDAQGKVNTDGAFRVSQCFYGAADPSRSVSLTLMQTNPANPGKRTIKEFWHEAFDRFAKPDHGSESAEKRDGSGEEQEKEEEEEKKKNPPRHVEGLGEDSYWTSNHIGGTLYVLKGEALLRISLGGSENESNRIRKSKALAEMALARL